MPSVGLVTLGQVNMPHSMPFTLIGLFQHLDVTFYKTCMFEVKQELFLLLLVLPFQASALDSFCDMHIFIQGNLKAYKKLEKICHFVL